MRDYVGDVWYQTTVRVPRGWGGQRILVHFESATHRATVWVNDAEVVSHEGGYTPFEADVSAHLAPGHPSPVTVVVNNTLSFQSIPPGVIEEPRTASGSGTGTTSSTTPGSTAPRGCTPRRTRT